ncbi:MAG: oligosaccharide flippase family protein [Halobacteria archaeon]|nr:oligosaccharide flippase family protein [Halobacteria archaeon]
MRLAKKSILYFVSDIATSIIGFLATLYFARVLGAGPLGKYVMVIALLAWITIPTNGIATAINKRVSEGKDANEIFSAGLLLNIFYGVAVSLVAVLGGRYINAYIGTDISIYFAFLVIANILFTSAREGLNGRKKVAHAGFLQTFDRLVRTAGQVALIYLGYKVLGLVSGHVVALVVSLIVGIVLFGFRPKLPDKEAFKSLVSYGRYSWLGSMKSKTFGWIDTLVLGLFVSSGFIGIYEVSWRLASVLILASNAVQHTIFPEISDVAKDGDYDEVRNLLNEALFFSGIFIIPGFFGVLVLGERILRIYGSEFVKGSVILLILILARAIDGYGIQFLNVINGINRPDVAFRINLLFIFTNTALNFVLIYLFGWYGAAVATAVSALLVTLLSYRSIESLVGVPEIPVIGVLKQILAGSGMAILLTGVNTVTPVRNMYVTIAMIFFGAFVYMVILFGISERVRSKIISLVR